MTDDEKVKGMSGYVWVFSESSHQQQGDATYEGLPSGIEVTGSDTLGNHQ
jgi:hypothetical protein